MALTISEDIEASGTETPREFPLVGVGASAGGIEAFTILLRNLPPSTGMGFVYIQHLDSTHKSMLPEIFGRETQMKVIEASPGTEVKPDKLYIIPPNTTMTIRNGVLVLTRRSLPPGHHLPIDEFLRSLAEEHPSRGVAVVLSGASSDGALGLVAVKQSGGITFAQDDSARHVIMPHHAINTGAVDFVMGPAEIAGELARISGHPYLRSARRELPEIFPPRNDSAFDSILEVLKQNRKVDFSPYRSTTLKRRIARRMSIRRVEQIEDYLSILKSNPEEVDALFNEMLIKVTSFFRDPDMFRSLADLVIPGLVRARRNDDPIRIWVPACCTGEEAYSLAMAFLESRGPELAEVPIQVFATDLSQPSIDHARSGLYVENICMDVSPARLKRFFHRVEDHFRINKSVRDMCVFARHDVTKDPPFSKLDLISCRNLLIYMSPGLQRSVVARLHYGLKPDGFLVLGGSESMLGHSDLFTGIEKTHRIFRKVPINGAQVAESAGDAAQPSAMRAALAQRTATESAMIGEADRVSVARSEHIGVVVDGNGRILQYRGDTAGLLIPAQGRASLDVLKLAQDELRLPLRAALEEANQTGSPVHVPNVQIRQEGEYQQISLEVLPLRLPGANKHNLILFDRAAEQSDPHPNGAPPDIREIRRLRQQLAATTDYLESIIEELKASGEEVQSSNEELQSVNEEIETGKEELQSGNEELSTVNDQLLSTNASLNQSNADLRNLLAAVGFPIVVLGKDLSIRMFTPSASAVFNFIATDEGRDIGHFRSNLTIENLPELVRRSVELGIAHEQEVADRNGAWYLLRITPSRDQDTHLEGVILTLIDIDSRKRAEQDRERLVAELERQKSQLARLVEHMPSALIVAEAPSGSIILTNLQLQTLFPPGAVTNGSSVFGVSSNVVHADGTPYRPEEWPIVRALRNGETVKDETMDFVRDDGTHFLVRANAAPIRDPSGQIALAIVLFDEITDVDLLRRRIAQTEKVAQSQRLETIGRLAGGVAHDFNNLLTVIIGFSQFVRDDRSLSAHLQDQMDEVIQAANRAATLTSQLLAFSRRQPIQPRQIDLNVLVSRVGGMLRRLVPERISFNIELHGEPCMVLADPAQTEQILMNLVSNSVDAIENRGIITVETGIVETEPGSNAVGTYSKFAVTDNGRGMSDEVREHIFEPFFTTKEFGKGTGLGLASVFGTVQQHNGDIRVRSALGEGTRIEVLLPCAQPNMEKAVSSSIGWPGGTETILVAEDEPAVRALTSRTLRNLGYTVLEAANGREALRTYRTHPGVVNLLLTDVVMPEMGGQELMHKLLQLQPGLKTAFMSGYPREVAGELGTLDRNLHFIQKPFNFADLSRVIREALES